MNTTNSHTSIIKKKISSSLIKNSSISFANILFNERADFSWRKQKMPSFTFKELFLISAQYKNVIKKYKVKLIN